jgi:hypothetical protein
MGFPRVEENWITATRDATGMADFADGQNM